MHDAARLAGLLNTVPMLSSATRVPFVAVDVAQQPALPEQVLPETSLLAPPALFLLRKDAPPQPYGGAISLASVRQWAEDETGATLPSSNVVRVTADTHKAFNATVMPDKHTVSLVFFYAEWSKPCQIGEAAAPTAAACWYSRVLFSRSDFPHRANRTGVRGGTVRGGGRRQRGRGEGDCSSPAA